MPVIDVAREEIVTASQDQTAGNLATLMKEENVGSVVIEENDEPVGIVTDRDLTLQVLESRSNPKEVTASDIMTASPATVSEDAGVFEAIQQMHDHSVRRMPVVNTNGKLSGIVTLDDFMIMIVDELDALTGVIEAEAPPY